MQLQEAPKRHQIHPPIPRTQETLTALAAETKQLKTVGNDEGEQEKKTEKFPFIPWVQEIWIGRAHV